MISATIKIAKSIAVDSETMGLNQNVINYALSNNGDEICHLIKIDQKNKKPLNLIKILKIIKFKNISLC